MRLSGKTDTASRGDDGAGPVIYALILLVGLVAGAISGIVGTGSSILLLPFLVFQFGPKQAVPIMALAALMANVAKTIAYWREIEWRAVAAYAIPGAPAAILGARTLLVLPTRAIDIALGVFFLAMIPLRHWLRARTYRVRLWQLAIAGAAIGFMTGIVLSTGPLSVPAFSSYGLVRGAFLSTEAASSLVLMASKVITFEQLGALPPAAVASGLLIGSSVMMGSFAGKAIVRRMSIKTFESLLDAILIGSGLSLLRVALG